MVSVKHHCVLLPLVFIVIAIWPNASCQSLDFSKVTLDSRYFVLFSCARDLNVPEELIELYKFDIFPDDQLTCCVFRCLGMRLGIYDDVNGFDVDKQYERVKDSLCIDKITYKRGVSNCIRNVLRGRTLNACEKAYLIITKCQGDTINNIINQQLNALTICD
ncbi:uncharacterized protein LOC126559284 [Anopheles maculipalpis]|uniref:uncharacterized protein LOC126559284 n=1 Tax=Anopheles maculipalpis TaxID=1496333 RepID=UPI002158E295|nr:uncharacterized protein LOC126559284 [Anopheles maculipalpis]